MSYWFGETPNDWDVVKIKTIFNMVSGGTPKSDVKEYWSESEVIWVTPEDLSKEGKYLEDSIRKISFLGLENCSANFIKANSIVLSTRAPIGNVKIPTVPFTTNQGCKSLESKSEVNINFYYYVIDLAKEHLNTLGQGTTFLELSNYNLKNVFVPYPNIKLQDSIAHYLDTKCKQIDELIVSKKKQISLLEQQRQSIITEAVTKGLKPNVKMKDSGIEWIGEIPEHWEVNKIKFKFDIRKVIQPTENPTVLSLTQRGLKIKDLNDFSGQHAESYDKYQKVEINDYVMNGMDLLTGYVDCSPFEGVTSPDYRVFRIKDNSECHDYYLRYFQICYFEKIFYGHGQGVSNFGRWRLQTDVFKEFPIPVPSKEEQFEISVYLKIKEMEINKALELIKLDIEKLKEYRQALIYEAVTGKIDVRDMELD
jgi:type I restriction enzyme, S subunit